MTVEPLLLIIVTFMNPMTLTLLTEKHFATTFTTRELVLWSTMESINQLEQAGLNQIDWGEWKSWSVVRRETRLNARLAFEWHRGQFGLKWCSVFLFCFFAPSCNTIAGLCPIRSNSTIHYLATLEDWVRLRWDTEREILSERMERDCHCGLTCTCQSLDSVTVLTGVEIISQPGSPI